MSSSFNSVVAETEDLVANYSNVLLNGSFEVSATDDLFGDDVAAKDFLDKLVGVMQQTCQKLVEKDGELRETSQRLLKREDELLEVKEILVVQNQVTKEEKKKNSEMNDRYAILEVEVDRLRAENVKLKNELKTTKKEEMFIELKELKKDLQDFKVIVHKDISLLQTRISNDTAISEQQQQQEQRQKQEQKNRKQQQQQQQQQQQKQLQEKQLQQKQLQQKQLQQKQLQQRQLQLQKQQQQQQQQKLQRKEKVESLLDQLVGVLNSTQTTEADQCKPNDNSEKRVLEKRVTWDEFNTGQFASSYMDKKGHVPGTGLGVNGDGITEPVEAAPRNSFAPKKERPSLLIAGTSMIGGLRQQTMSKKFKVKVRPHPGARIPAMHKFLEGHLLEKFDHLILQVGTNDSVDRHISSDDIYNKIMDLKAFAEETSPGINVVISCPLVRTDDAHAKLKLVQVKNRLKRASGDGIIKIIENDNIEEKHLSTKGLHLNGAGTRELAKNMISYMRGIQG
jgi:hypothetical protein